MLNYDEMISYASKALFILANVKYFNFFIVLKVFRINDWFQEKGINMYQTSPLQLSVVSKKNVFLQKNFFWLKNELIFF